MIRFRWWAGFRTSSIRQLSFLTVTIKLTDRDLISNPKGVFVESLSSAFFLQMKLKEWSICVMGAAVSSFISFWSVSKHLLAFLSLVALNVCLRILVTRLPVLLLYFCPVCDNGIEVRKTMKKGKARTFPLEQRIKENYEKWLVWGVLSLVGVGEKKVKSFWVGLEHCYRSNSCSWLTSSFSGFWLKGLQLLFWLFHGLQWVFELLINICLDI